MSRITAQHAQEWNTWGAPPSAEQKLGVFTDACARVDVDAASKHKSVQSLFMLTDDQSQIDDALAGPRGEATIAGSEEAIVDAIGRYADLGFDEVIVPDFVMGETAEDRRDAYARFTENVMAQFS